MRGVLGGGRPVGRVGRCPLGRVRSSRPPRVRRPPARCAGGSPAIRGEARSRPRSVLARGTVRRTPARRGDIRTAAGPPRNPRPRRGGVGGGGGGAVGGWQAA